MYTLNHIDVVHNNTPCTYTGIQMYTVYTHTEVHKYLNDVLLNASLRGWNKVHSVWNGTQSKMKHKITKSVEVILNRVTWRGSVHQLPQ